MTIASPLIPAALCAVLLLGACATSGPPSAASPSAPTPSTTSPPAARPTGPAAAAARPGAAASGPVAPAARPPGTPPPFAEVVRHAKRSDGFVPIWRQDEKVWLEIAPDRLDRLMFLGNSRSSGLGESYFLPGLMGRESLVVLRRAGTQLQLLARHVHTRARPGTPLARALDESYSDSLLSSAPVVSAPHPERRSVLVDALALFGPDITGTQTQLEAAFRLPYALDRTNTTIERTRVTPDLLAVTLRSHFALPKLPAPPRATPGGPPPNPAQLPNPPRTLPDARSLFLGTTYTLAPLPAEPMKPRRADPRVGHFTDSYTDLDDDTSEGRRVHLVNRWRLEKRDPAAAVSEPRRPIRVVMDRNIPLKWRDSMRAGILEWNKAFEGAGFRNALHVEQQPDDADDTVFEGLNVLAVRWFVAEGPGALAVGPSQSDPRTGEILRAAAIIPENWARYSRRSVVVDVPRFAEPPAGLSALHDESRCSYALDALANADFALALLAERGALDPNGPDGERFVADSLKEVTMHEVGHTLGLRHNFRASTGITAAQLRDTAFTRRYGISNSIMDYVPPNLPLDGEPVGEYHMGTLGRYDHWAIAYAYRDFGAADEATELDRLAAQSARDPALAYASDPDAGIGDPRVNIHDLGDDPLAFALREMNLVKELWTRAQTRTTPVDTDLSLNRRQLERGLSFTRSAAALLAKHVGGIEVSRLGASDGHALVVPVDAARQRHALDALLGRVFASDSFHFDPAFMTRLGVDHLERGARRGANDPDFSLPTAVLAVQRVALDPLMADTLAQRLADAEAKLPQPDAGLSFAEVQQRLADSVWSELTRPADIDSLRRGLQREHLKRLAGALLRPGGAAGDARAAHLVVAQGLDKALARALAVRTLNAATRAHLTEAQRTLAEALRAGFVRSGA